MLNGQQRGDFIKGVSFILGVPLVFIVGCLIYWLVSVPAGNRVVNEETEPLAVGETWSQGELFSLTLKRVEEIKHLPAQESEAGELSDEEFAALREQGFKGYDLCFAVKNIGYEWYTDIYRSNYPFVEGLSFWLNISADNEDADGKVIEVNAYQTYPAIPLGIKQKVGDNHCLILVSPEVEVINVTFATNREAVDSETHQRAPRPIYQQTFRVYL